MTPSHPLCGLRNEQRPGGPRPPALDVSRTSRELADDAHGDVGAGPRAPQPAAALDPVAAVVAQHTGAQAWGPPVGVVHSCVVLPDQGSPCGKGGIGGGALLGMGANDMEQKQMGEKSPVLENPHIPQILTPLPQALTPHAPTPHHRPNASGGPPPAARGLPLLTLYPGRPPLGLKFMPSQAPRLCPSELCRCSQTNTFSISSRMDRTAPPAGHKGGRRQGRRVSWWVAEPPERPRPFPWQPE